MRVLNSSCRDFKPPDWDSLEKSRGNYLPHWHCDRAVYHVSFRLADALPGARLQQWLDDRRNILENISDQNREPTEYERQRLRNLYSERIETYLNASHGACLLARPAIGKIVADSLEFFHGQRYWLHVYCVMPNHVHVLVKMAPTFDLADTVHSWTKFTAFNINKRLTRWGTIWQREPYDHMVRSGKEYIFQMEYIWRNPGNMRQGFMRKRFDGDK